MKKVRDLIHLLDQLSERYEASGEVLKSSSLDKISFLLSQTDRLSPNKMSRIVRISSMYNIPMFDALILDDIILNSKEGEK